MKNLYNEIASLPNEFAEQQKLPIIAENADYLKFISDIVGIDTDKVKSAILDLHANNAFFANFLPKLNKLDGLENAGDLRFHSLTVYLVVLLTRPKTMIETGVAFGKSSVYALLAMSIIKKGRLYSYDLIPSGKLAIDGSSTSMDGFMSATLVLNELRNHWTLVYGDSLKNIENMASCFGEGVDIFLHDSLHTFKHTKSEFDLVMSFGKKTKNTIFMCDNLEMGSGEFFDTLSNSHKLNRFSNFGVAVPWN